MVSAPALAQVAAVVGTGACGEVFPIAITASGEVYRLERGAWARVASALMAPAVGPVVGAVAFYDCHADVVAVSEDGYILRGSQRGLAWSCGVNIFEETGGPAGRVVSVGNGLAYGTASPQVFAVTDRGDAYEYGPLGTAYLGNVLDGAVPALPLTIGGLKARWR